MDSIYTLERAAFVRLIAQITLALGEAEREALAVCLSSAIAGSTMFLGFEKPSSHHLALYGAITCRALVDLVRTLRPDQLEANGWRAMPAGARWGPPGLNSADADARPSSPVVRRWRSHRGQASGARRANEAQAWSVRLLRPGTPADIEQGHWGPAGP